MATPPHSTPSPTTTPTGTAVPLPPEYAALNTPEHPDAGILKYADDYYQKTGILPERFRVVNGHAVEWEPGFFSRHPWLYPVLGIAIGLTAGVASGAFGGGTGTGMAGGAPGAGAAGTGGAGAAGLGPETLFAGEAGMTTPIAGGAGAAAAADAGAWDAAGNFIGPSTVTGEAASTGWRRYLDAAGDVGSALSGIEAGRQSGREAENRAYNDYNSALQQQYRTQVSANANENDFGLGRYNADLNTSTAANNFGLGRYNADLNTATAANNFGLGRYDAALETSTALNNFGLGRYNADLNTSTARNTFELGRVNAGIGLSDADLRQQQFSLDKPKTLARNSVQGDILANARDVSINAGPNIPIPTITGGLRPSMFSDNTRALGAGMSAQALASQRAGDTFKPLPDLPSYQGPSTALPDYSGPSVGLPDYQGPSSGLPDYQGPSSGLPSYVQPPAAPGVTPPVSATGLDTALQGGGYMATALELLRKYYAR